MVVDVVPVHIAVVEIDIPRRLRRTLIPSLVPLHPNAIAPGRRPRKRPPATDPRTVRAPE